MDPEETKGAAVLVEQKLFDKREIDLVFKAYHRARTRTARRKRRENMRCCGMCWRRTKLSTESQKLSTIREFYAYYRLEPSSFTTQILLLAKTDFKAGDDPDEVQLAFLEFAVAVWLLCSFQLATLAFSIMDTDGWGHATRDQIRKLVAQVYANPTKTVGKRIDASLKGGESASNLQGADEKMTKFLGPLNAKQTISLAEFSAITKKHHNLLVPAFRVQRAVRETTFGHNTNWDKVEVRRQEVVGGRTIREVITDLGIMPAGCVPKKEETYKYEVDSTKVLDHAVEAYRSGDYDRARTIHEHFQNFDTLNPKAQEKQRQFDEAKLRAQQRAEEEAKNKKMWLQFLTRKKKYDDTPSVVRNPTFALTNVS